MAGENKKITAEVLYIYFDVRNTLCSIYQNGYIVQVGYADDLFDRINRPKGIGNVCQGHYFGPVRNKRFKQFIFQFTVILKRQYFEYCFLALTGHLPWYDIGVMLHLSDNNLIPFG